ncbi:MAG: hypothetical protein ACK4MU_09320, partial [Thermomonas sp.]
TGLGVAAIVACGALGVMPTAAVFVRPLAWQVAGTARAKQRADTHDVGTGTRPTSGRPGAACHGATDYP